MVSVPPPESAQHAKIEARRVLKDLRDHQDDIRVNRASILDPRSNLLAAHFLQTKENSKKSDKVDQKLLDAQILQSLCDITRRQALSVQCGLKDVDLHSFVAHLAVMRRNRNLGRMGRETGGDAAREEENASAVVVEEQKPPELDLRWLGGEVHHLFQTFPSATFMFGNSEVEPKVHKARAAPARRTAVEATKPAEVEAADTVEITETDREVKEMFKLLRVRKRMNFWEFIVDPNNFGRTIENAFHCSFLVKDEKAKLDFLSEPFTIELREQRAEDGVDGVEAAMANDEDDNAVNSQYILKLDYKLWKNMTEKYRITECLLPARRIQGLDDNDSENDGSGMDK